MSSLSKVASAQTPSLLSLTAAAASADAISYVGLGHVFPANMTGNTVLLAIGLTTGDHAGAARSAVALCGFVLGAATAGATGSRRRNRVVALLLGELGLLLAAYCWWSLAGTGHGRLGLIALLAVAMGIQSAVVTGLDVGVSTTYITGTWTSISITAAQWLHRSRPQDHDRTKSVHQSTVLVCYIGTALLTGWLSTRSTATTASVPAVAVTVAGGLRLLRAHVRQRPPENPLRR